MNLMAKLKAMQREIEALRARVEEMDGRRYVITVDEEGMSWAPRPSVKTQLPDAAWKAEPLPAPIVDAQPIASATMAPPPKKRGRPPKAT